MRGKIIIFPNQLFPEEVFDPEWDIVVISHPKFYSQDYSWVKLTYTCACLLAFLDHMKNIGRNVSHIFLESKHQMKISKEKKVRAFDPTDSDLSHFLKKFYPFAQIMESPMFIHTRERLKEGYMKKKVSHGFHKNFYVWSVGELGTPVD